MRWEWRPKILEHEKKMRENCHEHASMSALLRIDRRKFLGLQVEQEGHGWMQLLILSCFFLFVKKKRLVIHQSLSLPFCLVNGERRFMYLTLKTEVDYFSCCLQAAGRFSIFCSVILWTQIHSEVLCFVWDNVINLLALLLLLLLFSLF